MSDSAGRPSPTGLLSPTDEVDRDPSGNGFTAVNNGRNNTPPGVTKIVRMAEGDRLRQEERGAHAHDSADMHRTGNGSPLNGASKRKRSSIVSNEEESDESESNDGSPEAGDPLQGSSRVYPGPPPPPPTGDARERAWNSSHGRAMEADPESRLAEALQRENQGGPSHHNGAMDDDRGMSRPSYYHNEHNGIITTNAGVQMDPKKRKRVCSVTT
jgi:hypothetical protein